MIDYQKLLGKSFKGTLIHDEVLDPYFIVRYAEGGFGVMKTRVDGKGNTKFKVVGYPSTFLGSLDMVAREKQHGEGQAYNSIQDYIDSWKKILTEIINAYKKWDVNPV